jgi:hypothetical protein
MVIIRRKQQHKTEIDIGELQIFVLNTSNFDENSIF